MTNNTFLLVISLNMMMLGSQAFAASTVDLAVDGSITPAACTPTLSGGGVVDYGDIHASTITQQDKELGLKDITLGISCAGPTRVGFNAQDNRSGTAIYEANITTPNGFSDSSPLTYHRYGFGTSTAGKKIGAYIIFAGDDFTGGGISYNTIDSTNGTPWRDQSNTYVFSDSSRIISFALPAVMTPEPITSVSGTIRIGAVISKRDGLTFADEVNMDGSVILSLVYL